MTTYWLLEELESKNDPLEKNLSYVQPSSFHWNKKLQSIEIFSDLVRLPPIHKKEISSTFLAPSNYLRTNEKENDIVGLFRLDSSNIFMSNRSPSPRKTTTFNLITLEE